MARCCNENDKLLYVQTSNVEMIANHTLRITVFYYMNSIIITGMIHANIRFDE